MLALLGLILILALAIALAPVILGVLGTMFALIFTALLYFASGCPRHPETPRTEAQKAEDRAMMEQLEEWERADKRAREERRHHGR